MLFVYNAIIRLYYYLIWAASFFNTKAKLWLSGRKDWKEHLKIFQKKAKTAHQVIWIHCASLGEFEQGRPLIESIRASRHSPHILLTFFSPSGYAIRKDYPLVDHVAYLPLDTKKNANQFLEIIRPDLAIFVKYEFWVHFIQQTAERKIPIFLISAIFRPDQLFFRWYGSLFKKLLKKYTCIFVQNESSKKNLERIGLQDSVSITGDTRIDRVSQIARQAPPIEIIDVFCKDVPVLICGSTWPEDEKILAPFVHRHLPKNWKVIVAPHDVHPKHIREIQKLFPKAIRYSELTDEKVTESKHTILIVDNIGMLSAIYQYGKLAYIGGGFGKNIHNILEPMAFGLPVIFGPKYKSFQEAVTMVKKQGAFSIKNEEELCRHFLWLEKETNYQLAQDTVKLYITENEGATEAVFQKMEKILFKRPEF